MLLVTFACWVQCKRGDKGMDRLSYGPYLYALEPDVLAVLTMHGELHKSWLRLHAIGIEPLMRRVSKTRLHQQMLLSKPSVLSDGFFASATAACAGNSPVSCPPLLHMSHQAA